MSVHKYFLPPAVEGGKPRARWRVNFDLPPHPETGKRRRGTRKGFTTRGGAVEWEDRLRGRKAAAEVVANRSGDQLVGDYLRGWVAGLSRKRTTLAAYRVIVESKIIPSLGGYRLGQLTRAEINRFYRWLEAEGGVRRYKERPGGEWLTRATPLAPKSVLNIHRVLHKALEDAVADKLIVVNPAARAEAPSWDVAVTWAAVRDVWTVDQLNTWLTATRGDRLYGTWRLLASTGLRRGELAGLPWRNVDFDGGLIVVTEQLTVADGELVWEPTAKTPKGDRKVLLDERTVQGLRSQRARQAGERLLCGPDYDDRGLVTCWPDGSPVHPDRLLDWVHAWARRLGLPDVTVHGLRHTYATMAIDDGEDVKVVSERLGHKDVATTLRVYRHVSERAHREAAERIARRITG